ncbi:MAG: AAA family ATPase [Phycisphaerae bacterium]
MRVIAVFNHKGGCGKTTTAINLAGALATAGRRVLLVDLDAQAHATVGCGVREDEVELSTWHALTGEDSGSGPIGLPDIAWEIFERFYLAPAAVRLAALEQTLAGVDGREQRLARLLERARGRYDVAIVDCGPGLGILAMNALVAAGEVVVPVDLGFFSVYGLGRVLETLDLLGERTGHTPTVGVLATMYDARARSMRRSLAALRERYTHRLFDTVIRFNVDLREAAAMGSPIVEFKPESRGHEDYWALAQEVLASDLHVAADDLARRQAGAAAEAERRLDQKVEAVYGPVPTGDGVCFRCHAPQARRVQVAGDFNGWHAEDGGADMEPGDRPGVWRKQVALPPGRYAYRLIIDGRWCSDPANPYVESNPYGELNSVVEVP